MRNFKTILFAFYSVLVPHYVIFTILNIFFSALIIDSNLIYNQNFTLLLLMFSFAIFGFNSLNMIFDKNIDNINKPNRAIPSKILSVKAVFLICALFYFIAIVISIIINLTFILLLFILTNIFYTHPNFYLKSKTSASSIFGAIFYGILPFFSIIFLTQTTKIPYEFLGLLTFSIFFIAPVKDIEDVKGEKKFKFKSMPIIFGSNNTLSTAMFGVAGIILITGVISLAKEKFSNFLAPILSLTIWVVVSIFVTKSMHKNEKILTQHKAVTILMIGLNFIELIYVIFFKF